MTLHLYVVTALPARDEGGVGFLDWWPAYDAADLDAITETYVRAFRMSARRGGSHVVRLIETTMPYPPSSPEATTNTLDRNLDLLATNAPALRQYVPPTTIPEHVPTGGVKR